MMAYSKSSLAFDDIRELLDKALEAPLGLRITCESHAKAVVLRARINYFKSLDRKDSTTTYDSGHFMWNKSAYDRLSAQLPKKGTAGDNILYIGPRKFHFSVEEIKEEPTK